MSNHHTDSTIVECCISLRIEEWILEDTCWEGNLIGCWVIISIDCLWSHVPLVTVHWLSCLVIDMLVVSKLAACHHVLIETLRWIDLKTAIVCPLVRVTDLHIELVELFVSCCLGSIAHPGLCIDTLTETYLKIFYQFQHDLLGRLWEVALAVHTTERFAQLSFYLTGSTLPKRIILLTATHCLAEEIKVSLTDLICKIRR